MSLTGYIIFYGFITVILLLYFMKAKSKRRASKLNMKKPSSIVDIPQKLEGESEYEEPVYSAVSAPPYSVGEKALNVIFNYNGHSWDAYEALGIPAGSSIESVEVAFKEAISKVDERSKHFVEAAYYAIHNASQK